MSKPMWLIRAGRKGVYFDDFKEKNIVAIGWSDAGNMVHLKNREEFFKHICSTFPENSRQSNHVASSQIYRFMHEIKISDHVITYDSANRIYIVGEIASAAEYNSSILDGEYSNIRKVSWKGTVERDKLSSATKYSLGAIQTLFQVASENAEEILTLLHGKSPKISQVVSEENVVAEQEPFLDMQERAKELIKDRISQIDWEDMQDLVAGLLRAMGYKTRVSSIGPDRGKDIMASPDGFGLERPRIKVEVKHRRGQMGAPDIRSFLSVVRHVEDKGLYVSTGGFSKEAYYEAERASNPITLMNIDDFVEAIMEHYEKLDTASRLLLPLTRIYWPTSK
ncbi:MAG TPA: restriction endonuclease [Alphaproteobacteria bacterium]|nr:restriction endonuclease [Alphaproteobacteria bacterium]